MMCHYVRAYHMKLFTVNLTVEEGGHDRLSSPILTQQYDSMCSAEKPHHLRPYSTENGPFVRFNTYELCNEALASRLTNDSQDPLFKDACEEHENSKTRSQHTDLQTEKIGLSLKVKTPLMTYQTQACKYGPHYTDAVILMHVLAFARLFRYAHPPQQSTENGSGGHL